MLKMKDPAVSFNREATTPSSSAVFYRDLNHPPPNTNSASGHYYFTKEGTRLFDACGGSASASLGHGNKQVRNAVVKQMESVSYYHTQYFTCDVTENLAHSLIDASDGKMARFLALCSGSEAMEVAMKIARQYYLELPEPQVQRCKFISRRPSYHGATLATLSLGGFLMKRSAFEPLLSNNVNHVSPCYPYRGKLDGETDEQYVARLAQELDDEFKKVGPETVCAFVAETVGGASLGAVPPVKGYFKAMQDVCNKHEALLILDEVMCGIGRTGTMYAWQQEGIVPSIQAVGKALGAGYIPISGVLINHAVSDVISNGSGMLRHGQSFLGHPTASAAALEVQNIIKQQDLLSNVQKMGALLSKRLVDSLGSHPHVGNIRGRGLLWGIELVQNTVTKEPFAAHHHIGPRIQEAALGSPYNICVYPGSGCAGDGLGDNLLLCPPFTIDEGDVDIIVERVTAVIVDFFDQHSSQLLNGK